MYKEQDQQINPLELLPTQEVKDRYMNDTYPGYDTLTKKEQTQAKEALANDPDRNELEIYCWMIQNGLVNFK